MSRFGHICPFCRAYNAKGEARCTRCEARLPPEPFATAMRWLKTTDNASTMVLGGINIVVFALMVADTVSVGSTTSLLWSMPRSTVIRFGALGTGLDQELGRYVSACFVHLSLIHIGFNMLALADLGKMAEQKVGSLRLVAAYLLTGVVGFIASHFWYAATHTPYVTAGASGAIFGLYGIVIASLAVRRDKAWKEVLFRVVVQSFVWYFVLHTNQAAHLGGLAAGLALGAVLELERRPWRRDSLLAVLALLGLVGTLGSLALAQRSPIWRLVREHEELRKNPAPRDIVRGHTPRSEPDEPDE